MKNHIRMTIGASLVLFVLSACSEETKPAADSGKEAAVPDLAAADSAPKEAAVPDTAAPDTAAADSTPADQAPADKPRPDQAQKPDSARPDSAKKPDQATGDAGPCGCKLANDCCWCQALASTGTPNPCAISGCKQNTCEAASIKKPSVYCWIGKCFLFDDGTTCKSDSDCFLVNNCCNCAALPKTASTPACPISSCFVPTCTSRGVGTAKAGCVSGRCKLK
jgi:hypothetical protein